MKIHKEGKILQVCKNIAKELADDLYQEILIILMEYKKLEEIYSKAEDSFNYFIIKIINNIWGDSAQRFKKKYYYSRLTNFEFVADSSDKKTFEIQLTKIERAMSKIDADCRQKKVYPLGGRLFEIYLREGSIRKVEKATNIHANHVHKEITNYRKEVLKVYKEL